MECEILETWVDKSREAEQTVLDTRRVLIMGCRELVRNKDDVSGNTNSEHDERGQLSSTAGGDFKRFKLKTEEVDKVDMDKKTVESGENSRRKRVLIP